MPMFVVPPCDLCGTAGGKAAEGRRGKPLRYRGESFGVEGLICSECRGDLIDELIDEQTRALGIEDRVAVIRRAKLAKVRGGLYGCDDLTADELDDVMPLDNEDHRGGVFPFGMARAAGG